MPFQALTPSFVSSFDLYLRADLKMALGTVNNIIGRLRSVIKSALNDGLLRKDPLTVIRLIIRRLFRSSFQKRNWNR